MMRVLVVDDDAVSRQILRAVLEHSGFEVVEFHDGLEAWEYLQRDPIRLIITNWMMPHMDGLELTRHIRAAGFLSYIYIILVTGNDTKAEVVNGLGAGADDYLIKPFDVKELAARVAIGKRILDLEDWHKDSLTTMEHMAMHDSLTELLNRRAIYTHAEAEMNRAKRSNQSVCLAMVDVDNFKHINDRFGHLAGDRALHLVAERLVSSVRNYNWVGRWGGDEFLLVMPECNEEVARLVCERILSSVRGEHILLQEGQSVEIHVSIGAVVVAGDEILPLDTIIQQADEVLYRAKQAGRDQLMIWNNTKSLRL